MAPGKHDDDGPDAMTANGQMVSKSQLKREAQAMKSLAGELLELSSAQLQRVPLDPDVLLAIQQARKIRSHGAQRRQLQYIAKLVRREDSSAIIDAVAALRTEARGLAARQHRSEAWREHLLEHGDAALGELLELRPATDAQAVRQLVRNAQREHSAGKPPAASRALFRMLRDMDAEQALPPCRGT